MKNIAQHEKCNKAKGKNHPNQEHIHRFVRAIEINLEDLLQIMPQIPRIRSFIKSKIIVTIFL